MKSRTAEMIVQDYILDLSDPRSSLRRSHFKQLSYTKWAAEEVLRTIRKRRDMSPTAAVEEFVNKMDQYALMHGNLSYIFSVAYDVGLDILDIFMAAE